jgi:hypothetical protein
MDESLGKVNFFRMGKEVFEQDVASDYQTDCSNSQDGIESIISLRFVNIWNLGINAQPAYED